MNGLVWILLLGLITLIQSQDFFHQSTEQHKLAPGWQEPGLWRPRWIMDRIMIDDDGEESRDRMYFKLNIDRTMKVYKSNRRPLLEIGSTKIGTSRRRNVKSKTKGAVYKKKSKPLFESDEDDEDDLVAQRKKNQEELDAANNQMMNEIDGTWWWQDAAPMNYAQVKLETREKGEKVRHEVLSDWGNLDAYAFNFRRGKIIKNRMGAKNLPMGSEMVGTFSIRVSPHRPMVGKDFLAFQ